MSIRKRIFFSISDETIYRKENAFEQKPPALHWKESTKSQREGLLNLGAFAIGYADRSVLPSEF